MAAEASNLTICKYVEVILPIRFLTIVTANPIGPCLAVLKDTLINPGRAQNLYVSHDHRIEIPPRGPNPLVSLRLCDASNTPRAHDFVAVTTSQQFGLDAF
jgi:hypothetical protein